MPRFVLLAHDHPFSHWDLMLECNGVLRTWRLFAIPEVGKSVTTEPLGDHRMAYLDYEGPVSGGRGSVERVDSGSFDWVVDSDEAIAVLMGGTRLSGRLELRKMQFDWIADLK